MDIQGKVALVTGAGRRVGKAIALGLASAGADIVVAYNASAEEADQTVREIEALGRRATAFQADLTSPSDISRLVADGVVALGGIDILVNSASRFDRKPMLDITPAEWDLVQAVNVRAPFLLSQSVTPSMRSRGGGVIINIADLSGLQAWPGYAHHAVSKAGLIHLTRVAARALGPLIRVNAIAPGTVLPPEDHDGKDSAGGPERRVLTRNGTPADVMEAVLYLVRSDFVTGDVIVVDGGRALL
ncbi:MAG: SDR family oxidoreductase [Longimicrobiales bacterium]